MANSYRLRVAWSGTGVVGPGLTTLFFDSTATLANITPAVNTFFTAIQSYMAPGITWTIPNGGDILDSATGALSGAWTSGGGSTVNSTGLGSYAAGVGYRVDFKTHIIRYGRRVRGGIFLCPMDANHMSNDGTPNNGAVTAIQTAANALIASAGVVPIVWARPNAAKGRSGENVIIDSATVPDVISWLRSRRT